MRSVRIPIKQKLLPQMQKNINKRRYKKIKKNNKVKRQINPGCGDMPQH